MPTQHRTGTNTPATRTTKTSLRRSAAATLLLMTLVATAPLATAQACMETNMNVQCTEFGAIKMQSRGDVKGEPLDIAATIILNTGYADQGARWVMFSARNVTEDTDSPVTIAVTRFGTDNGDIVTTRVQQDKASEVDLWVDVLDLPVGVPITLAMHIGVTERGAYSLEVLVLAFDRGYAPVKDAYGNDASLFSFTLLGVNKETSSTFGDGGGDGLVHGKKLPGLEFVATVASVAALGLALAWRRRK